MAMASSRRETSSRHFQSGGYEPGPRPPLVSLESTAITNTERSELLGGFERYSAWLGDMTAAGEFAQKLPLIGVSISELVDVADVLQTDVLDAIRSSLAQPNSTSDDLVQSLRQIGSSENGTTVEVQQAAGGRVSAASDSELRFHLQMSVVDVRQRAVELGSGTQLDDAFGLFDVHLNSSATVTVTTTATLNFTFGVNPRAVRNSDRFFVTLDEDAGEAIDVTVRVNGEFDAEGHVGILGVEATDANAQLLARLTTTDRNEDRNQTADRRRPGLAFRHRTTATRSKLKPQQSAAAFGRFCWLSLCERPAADCCSRHQPVRQRSTANSNDEFWPTR